VRALTAPAADGTPDWLRPLDLLERIHAGFLLVCVRQAPDLDLRCDERLAYGLAALTRALSHEPPRDELLRLAEEYQRTTPAVPPEFDEPIRCAVERHRPAPPPDPPMPSAEELAVAEAEARAADLDRLPAPSPALLPKPPAPAGVITLANGSVLLLRDLEPPGPFSR
jgi:hypothetical protein